MTDLPTYIIYDGTKVKRSAKTFIAEAQRNIIWQQVRGRKGLITEKEVYYKPGTPPAICTGRDLAALEAAMASEIRDLFPTWHQELVRGGASSDYLEHFEESRAQHAFPLLGSSGEASYMVYGMTRRQELGSGHDHKLGVKLARVLLKKQRDDSLKTLQALGL